MNPLRWPAVVSIAVVFGVFIWGCSKPYVPRVALPSSEKIIDAVVEFHPLRAAPSLESGHDTYGVLADNVTTPPPRELTDQISAALQDALASDHVFRQFSVFEPAPDLILTGRINRFYQHDRPRLWTYIPRSGTVASLFRMNTHVSNGEVDLTMFLIKSTGEVVGQYRGRKSFDETYRPHAGIAPGDRLNRAFSEAVHHIRDTMTADANVAKVGARR